MQEGKKSSGLGFLTCLLSSSPKRICDLLGLNPSAKCSRLAILSNGNRIQFAEPDLNTIFNRTQCLNGAVSTIVG